MKYLSLLLILSATTALAQSYNPGLPLPGLPKSVGPKLMAGSTSVTLATDQTAIPVSGSITATNPSIGINYAIAPTSSTQIGGVDQDGKLQPIVITSQGITVSSSATTVASSSISRVANITSTATLLVSNTYRKGAFFYNDSTTNCYVKFGATASLTSYSVKLFSTDTYIMDPPIYVGQVDSICDAANGSMQVTEQ